MFHQSYPQSHSLQFPLISFHVNGPALSCLKSTFPTVLTGSPDALTKFKYSLRFLLSVQFLYPLYYHPFHNTNACHRMISVRLSQALSMQPSIPSFRSLLYQSLRRKSYYRSSVTSRAILLQMERPKSMPWIQSQSWRHVTPYYRPTRYLRHLRLRTHYIPFRLTFSHQQLPLHPKKFRSSGL